ncbi:MAG TPA: HAD-IIIC family phosphatase [Clostridiales bacterium]|nr:HAD-IIIC family phosphatase [Clostridiales bacterium]
MKKQKKCLIWDLDNTLWDGILAEGGEVCLKDGIQEVLSELDKRGILLSIASKNDHDEAMAKLKDFGIEEFFLYPQISWSTKADSIAAIAKALNIAVDALAFVDDQAFEREEILYHHGDVMVIDAADYREIPQMEAFTPRFITEDSKLRREMYRSDLNRKASEEVFHGSSEEFLATLQMELTIAPVAYGDLERVEELTVRTNQLNSTGVTYSFEKLEGYINSPDHVFLVASLTDKFGTYGKIGIVLLEETAEELKIKLLLMSCRVMTRGIGSALLVHIIKLAQAKGKKLTADFIHTGKNRVMYVTYKLMGFAEENPEDEEAQRCNLVYNGQDHVDYPAYLKLTVS